MYVHGIKHTAMFLSYFLIALHKPVNFFAYTQETITLQDLPKRDE